IRAVTGSGSASGRPGARRLSRRAYGTAGSGQTLKSRTNQSFRRCFDARPSHVKALARAAYRRFSTDPMHPGLNFKRVPPHPDIYSIRIGIGYRALGVMPNSAEIVWYWIGSHADYDRMI